MIQYQKTNNESKYIKRMKHNKKTQKNNISFISLYETGP